MSTRATAQQLTELAKRDPIYCQVQRNAIWYHRNAMRGIAQWKRDRQINDWTALKLMRSHADDIKQIYREIDNACGHWSH